MKYCFVFLSSIFLPAFCFSQTICQTGNENTTLSFNAPAGKVFIAVNFASYGTPDGVCGSFTVGSCHAASSKTIVENALLGKNSATIDASNTVFGDPCGGTFKRLYVEAVYGNPLPLHLVSFTATVLPDYHLLQWKTENEENAKWFIVERSVDGIHYTDFTRVNCNNREKNEYKVTDYYSAGEGIYYYRLKMVDNDGSFDYSFVVRLKKGLKNQPYVVVNPVSHILTVNGLEPGGRIDLMNLEGTVLQSIRIMQTPVQIKLSSYARGIYFVRYANSETRFVERVVVP